MLDALTLDQMRVFVAVAEAGSFRAAAKRLLRVQSAVSHAMAGLEEQLGITLFDRSGHRPILTAEGRMLLADVRAILLKVDKMRARARGLGEGVELGFSLALDPQFPLDLATLALRTVQERYPSVIVRILTASLGEAIHALRERRATLAISTIDLPDPGIERHALIHIKRIAVVSANHPLAARAASQAPLTTEALSDHIQIVGEDPSPLTQGRDFAVLSPGTWRVTDNAAKLALIRAGTGWGNLPAWMVEQDIAQGRLARLPIAAFGQQGETQAQAYLMHRTDSHFGPAVRFYVQTLAERAGVKGFVF